MAQTKAIIAEFNVGPCKFSDSEIWCGKDVDAKIQASIGQPKNRFKVAYVGNIQNGDSLVPEGSPLTKSEKSFLSKALPSFLQNNHHFPFAMQRSSLGLDRTMRVLAFFIVDTNKIKHSASDKMFVDSTGIIKALGALQASDITLAQASGTVATVEMGVLGAAAMIMGLSPGSAIGEMSALFNYGQPSTIFGYWEDLAIETGTLAAKKTQAQDDEQQERNDPCKVGSVAVRNSCEAISEIKELEKLLRTSTPHLDSAEAAVLEGLKKFRYMSTDYAMAMYELHRVVRGETTACQAFADRFYDSCSKNRERGSDMYCSDGCSACTICYGVFCGQYDWENQEKAFNDPPYFGKNQFCTDGLRACVAAGGEE